MSKSFEEVLKKAKPLSDDGVKAKAAMLKKMMEMVKGGVGEELKGLKKVTVASDSPEGIEAGLEKAKELIAHETEETPAEEKSETVSEEKSEEEKIAELEKQLEELKAKKKGTELTSAKNDIKSIF